MAVLNAVQVRALAEIANGIRGETITFYQDPPGDGPINVWVPSNQGGALNPPAGSIVLLQCQTDNVCPDRPPLTDIQVTFQGSISASLSLMLAEWIQSQASGLTVSESVSGDDTSLSLGQAEGSEVDVALGVDALFFSESAVEKFLFPYYASKGGSQGDLYLAALRDVFYGPRLAGTPAFVEENPQDFEDASQAFVQNVESDSGDVPAGLVHIPKSDYIPEEESTGGTGSGTGGEPAYMSAMDSGGKHDTLHVLLWNKGTRRLRLEPLKTHAAHLRAAAAQR
jgi:hypothetical protein